jgi:peptidoglycan/LPS O-acetylase OafA/YrhL
MATASADLVLDRAEAPAKTWTVPAVVPELDGIRGIAIGLVLVCHATFWMPNERLQLIFREGKIGVDLFFVLSGFLITGILLDTQTHPKRAQSFYIRRGLRIWPLYFVYLAVAYFAFRVMLPPQTHLWAYFLFVQNFFWVDATGPFLQPTWSLAVEEQFYAVWPWLAFRMKRETVLKTCLTVFAIAPVIRYAFHLGGAGGQFIYANTLTRLDGIALGGAIAAWVRGPMFDADQLAKFAKIGAIVGTIGYVVCFLLTPYSLVADYLAYTFITMGFGGVVCFALFYRGESNWFAAAMRHPWLMTMGKISFALYLFNNPIYLMAHGNHVNNLLARLGLGEWSAGFTRLAIENVALFAAALLSWKLFESPILKLKKKWAPR